MLLDAGADVNGKNSYGETALYLYIWVKMHSYKKADPKIVKMLLEKGAAVDNKLLGIAKPRRLAGGAYLPKFNKNYRHEKKIYSIIKKYRRKNQ
jgi:hypothetical protein